MHCLACLLQEDLRKDREEMEAELKRALEIIEELEGRSSKDGAA